MTFRLKWLWLVQRPEEHFGCNMTGYDEGCPGHPGDPAGHGADAGVTAAGLVHVLRKQLTHEMATVIVETCLVFCMYRTLAGVHRSVENLRGFVVGWATFHRISFAEADEQIRGYVPGLPALT